jgi:hypothetical protein
LTPRSNVNLKTAIMRLKKIYCHASEAVAQMENAEKKLN